MFVPKNGRYVDQLICELWCAFEALSRAYPADKMTEEDLALWGLVTKHSAIQERLDKAMTIDRRDDEDGEDD